MYTYDSTSQAMPGYRFQYQVPPTSAALSISRMLCTPSSRSRAPVRSPPNPAPMIATSTSSDNGSRVNSGSLQGSFAKSSKRTGDLDVLRDAVGAQSPVPFNGVFLPQSIYVECHPGILPRICIPAGRFSHFCCWNAISRTRVSDADVIREMFAGQGGPLGDEVGRRPFEDDPAAVVAGTGTEVDDPVRVRHDRLVVLDHED